MATWSPSLTNSLAFVAIAVAGTLVAATVVSVAPDIFRNLGQPDVAVARPGIRRALGRRGLVRSQPAGRAGRRTDGPYRQDARRVPPDHRPGAERVAMVSRSVQLRSRPTLSAPKGKRLGLGDSVVILATEGDWLQVALTEDGGALVIGWIRRDNLAIP